MLYKIYIYIAHTNNNSDCLHTKVNYFSPFIIKGAYRISNS